MIARLLVAAFLAEAVVWVGFGIEAIRRCIIMLRSVKENAPSKMSVRFPLWVPDKDFEHPKGLEDRRLYGRALLRALGMVVLMIATIIAAHTALKVGL